MKQDISEAFFDQKISELPVEKRRRVRGRYRAAKKAGRQYPRLNALVGGDSPYGFEEISKEAEDERRKQSLRLKTMFYRLLSLVGLVISSSLLFRIFQESPKANETYSIVGVVIEFFSPIAFRVSRFIGSIIGIIGMFFLLLDPIVSLFESHEETHSREISVVMTKIEKEENDIERLRTDIMAARAKLLALNGQPQKHRIIFEQIKHEEMVLEEKGHALKSLWNRRKDVESEFEKARLYPVKSGLARLGIYLSNFILITIIVRERHFERGFTRR